ncbi:MAG: amidinotransferase [Chthoniobacterales bacterium]|nr:amidinotransferase [Chthoniobacterales bacterium]
MRDLLLCPPDHYSIQYEINPWMSRARGADTPMVQAQWRGLYEKLCSLQANVSLITPQPKLPDMVFTANAGLAVGRRFIPSNFRHQERSGEAAFFAQFMEEKGYEVVWLPPDLYFEGEGDALFGGDALFCGYKFRTDIQAHRAVADIFSCLVISVELVDPRFYHIDTCFCPLPAESGYWFPEAFDEYGQRAIRDRLPNIIDVSAEEAQVFCCNSVVLDKDIVMPAGAPNLVAQLTERGYTCHTLQMCEFLKAGGACKCLTMFMPQRQEV